MFSARKKNASLPHTWIFLFFSAFTHLAFIHVINTSFSLFQLTPILLCMIPTKPIAS
jgi:hypothetical protein